MIYDDKFLNDFKKFFPDRDGRQAIGLLLEAIGRKDLLGRKRDRYTFEYRSGYKNDQLVVFAVKRLTVYYSDGSTEERLVYDGCEWIIV